MAATLEQDLASWRSRRALSACERVGANMRRARLERGWTQVRARARLAECGLVWSSAVYSAAECSDRGARVRRFDADELESIARAFGLPVGFFFEVPR